MTKFGKKQKKLKKNISQSKLKRTEESSYLPETFTEAVIEKNIEDNACLDSNETIETPLQSHASGFTETEKNNIENPKKRKKIKGKAEHRSEASQSISEFNLTEVGKEKVKLDELIKTSQKISGQVLVKKQLENAKKLKSLSVPLSKPQLQKIKRTIAYGKVCNDVSKWDIIVKSNRNAEQIVYPLKRPEFHLESFETISEQFVSKHPVEVAVSEILKTSENVLDQTRTLTVAEEKALQAMSLEEAKMRHNELMKNRALMSYKEAKARRQNKIKSKRYHRMLKKEKLKIVMEEFEKLQKKDQKAALEKFLESDKLRILERMTLKHRNTGKWAKQQKIRARYNPESRSNLKEDITIGRKLREKVTTKMPSPQKTCINADDEDKFFGDPSENYLIEDIPNKDSTNEDFDSISKYGYQAESLIQKIESKFKKTEASVSKEKEIKISSEETNVQDPQPTGDFSVGLVSAAPNGKLYSTPDDIFLGGESLDNNADGKSTMFEKFADEKNVAEFQKEKKAAEQASKPERINMFLPGWGSWGGPGIKASKARRRRFFVKPVVTGLKTSTLGNVIINEEKDKKAAKHQVSHLPFPFSNVNQFESYIRQPIGHTWNPQSSFHNFIAPKVITKMGKVIDPINSEDVVLEKKTPSTTQLKRKKKKSQQEIKAF